MRFFATGIPSLVLPVVCLAFVHQAAAQVSLDLRPLEAELSLAGGEPGQRLDVPDVEGLKWLFVEPRTVFSQFLPDYLRPEWRPTNSDSFLLWFGPGRITADFVAAVLDSLIAHRSELEASLSHRLQQALWKQPSPAVRCYLYLRPDSVHFAAGRGYSVLVSVSPHIAHLSPVVIDWQSLQADAIEAIFRMISSEMLIEGDLLLEATGNHAAVREDLISRYGFGWVSLVSRALGYEGHHKDPDLLREIIDRWAETTSLDILAASKAAEMFREVARQGMAGWAAAPFQGISDTVLYVFQMGEALAGLEKDVDRFAVRFKEAVHNPDVQVAEAVRELTTDGVLRRIGMYMAKRIEQVLGRDRLLGSFSSHEVDFFLDYLALQYEADFQFDEEVCLWVFDLANELDRIRRLGESF